MFTRKGADLFLDKVITLKEALCGFTFKIKWLGGNVINVATLPGEVISDGQVKMIRGKGMPFFEDEISHGNLFIKIEVKMPPRNFIKGK